MSKKVTLTSIKFAEYYDLIRMARKRCQQVKNLVKLVSTSTNLDYMSELVVFIQTGEIPSAKVVRSQYKKIERLYVWMCASVEYDLLTEEIYDEFYKQCDRCVQIYPYLAPLLLENGIYYEVP